MNQTMDQNQAQNQNQEDEPIRMSGDVVDSNGEEVYKPGFFDRVLDFWDSIPKPVKRVVTGAVLIGTGAAAGAVGMKVYESRKNRGGGSTDDGSYWEDGGSSDSDDNSDNSEVEMLDYNDSDSGMFTNFFETDKEKESVEA